MSGVGGSGRAGNPWDLSWQGAWFCWGGSALGDSPEPSVGMRAQEPYPGLFRGAVVVLGWTGQPPHGSKNRFLREIRFLEEGLSCVCLCVKVSGW